MATIMSLLLWLGQSSKTFQLSPDDTKHHHHYWNLVSMPHEIIPKTCSIMLLIIVCGFIWVRVGLLSTEKLQEIWNRANANLYRLVGRYWHIYRRETGKMTSRRKAIIFTDWFHYRNNFTSYHYYNLEEIWSELASFLS